MPDLKYYSEQAFLRDYYYLDDPYRYKVDKFLRNLVRLQRAERKVSAEVFKLEREMKVTPFSEKQLICSFCGKPEQEAHRMIMGPNKVTICDECVGLCTDILNDGYEPSEKERGNTSEDNQVKDT